MLVDSHRVQCCGETIEAVEAVQILRDFEKRESIEYCYDCRSLNVRIAIRFHQVFASANDKQLCAFRTNQITLHKLFRGCEFSPNCNNCSRTFFLFATCLCTSRVRLRRRGNLSMTSDALFVSFVLQLRQPRLLIFGVICCITPRCNDMLSSLEILRSRRYAVLAIKSTTEATRS